MNSEGAKMCPVIGATSRNICMACQTIRLSRIESTQRIVANGELVDSILGLI